LVAQASACGFSVAVQIQNLPAKQAAEKVIYCVIPNEVRNLSFFDLKPGKERFLGTQRASE
jgi:hypothetical protein